MKKTLHDRLYLRFGLFHRRWGHAIAYMIEFLIVAVIAAIALAFLIGAVLFTYGMVDGYREAEAKAEKAKQETKEMEKVLINCMNGGLVGREVTGEPVVCRGVVDVAL